MVIDYRKKKCLNLTEAVKSLKKGDIIVIPLYRYDYARNMVSGLNEKLRLQNKLGENQTFYSTTKFGLKDSAAVYLTSDGRPTLN